MPLKRRGPECSNPLKRNHTKMSQFRDVHTLSTGQLERFSKVLYEYRWDTGVKLCSVCRSICLKHIVRRETAKKALEDIRNQSLQELDESSEDDVGVGEQLKPTDYPDITSSDSETSGQKNEAKRSDVQKPLQGLARSDDVTFPAPATPPSKTGASRSVRTVKGQSSSLVTASSPSVAASSVSTAVSSVSASTFFDEETAKIDLHRFLQNLGVTPPNKSTKTSRKRISALFGKATTAMKSLFSDYIGEPLQEESQCKCKHCLLLFDTVKKKLPSTKQKKEKYVMLTSLPEHVTIKMMHEELKISQYSAKLASFLRNKEGPFSFPNWKRTGRALSDQVKSLVFEFYQSDDNSRASPCARDTTLVRNPENVRTPLAKRQMLANLAETFSEFKRSHPEIKIGISAFSELRPKNCKWPGHVGVYVNCTCIIHQNFLLMLEGLKIASVEGIEQQFEDRPASVSYLELLSDPSELVKYLLCDPPTEQCFMGYCESCPNDIHIQEILDFSTDNEITYKFWSGNEISVRVDEHSLFSDNFRMEFLKFSVHDYIYRTQKSFIKSLKTGSMNNGTSCVLTVDFGENYSFVIQNAVQGFHWNNKQATIHPFVLYVASSEGGKSLYKTYFIISDEMCHDATSFHCFRARVMTKIKESYPNLTHVDYVSDGAGSQYKNYKNLGNLLFHKDDYNLSANWIFTATAHGKSTCDAMSAVVKRTMRLRSLNSGTLIDTPAKMYEVAVAELSSPTLEFMYVTKEDVQYWRDSLKTRYDKLEKIPSVRKNHYFGVTDEKLLISKRYAMSENYETHCVMKDSDAEHWDEDNTTESHNSNERPRNGNFLALFFAKSYQIGYVVEELEEDGLWRMQMMKKTGRAGAALLWPQAAKYQDVTMDDIIMKIATPVFNEQNGNYRLVSEDLMAIKDALATRKK